MTIATEWVTYGETQEVGYLARPVSPKGEQAPLPAVLVVQEIWGVDGHIQDVTRRFAAAGYVALAPDLYAKNGARPAALTESRVAFAQAFLEGLPHATWFDPAARATAFATNPEPQRTELEETFQALFGAFVSGGLKLEAWLPAVRAAATYVREECPASRGAGGTRVATVGFCMGGGLAALHACADPELAAAVIFYGSAPPAEQIKHIQCPVLGLYGSTDERINAGIPAFAAAMKDAGKSFEHHIYEGAGHAFFNDNRGSYHAGASRDAFLRTLELLRKQLV
jgi:carboxymethylenebutenolidase